MTNEERRKKDDVGAIHELPLQGERRTENDVQGKTNVWNVRTTMKKEIEA